MAITKLSDVIIPELFNPYVINRTKELSAIFSSGIVEHTAEYDNLASQASPLAQMPFWQDLSGDSEPIIEDAELTPEKIQSGKDVSVIFRRVKSWAATDLSAALAGDDPMKAIGDLVAQYWARDMQKELLAILEGVFGTYTPTGGSATTPMADHILDISGQSGAAGKWSGAAFIDAEQLLGDAKAQLTGFVMHSATEAALRKQNLIETVQPSDGGAFQTYMGKRYVVDDGCPHTDGGVYTTYLFGNGAIAYGNGSPVGFIPTEIDRKKLMGSGVDYLINRRTSILHPRGIKWTSAVQAHVETPTRNEFKNAANWLPVYEPKQLRIVAFKHKL